MAELPPIDKAVAAAVDVTGEIFTERARQITEEGWTPDNDDLHRHGRLALAAACYAMNASGLGNLATTYWPFASKWFKPKNPRADLIRAGALIVAEIERLDRAAG